MSTTEPLRVLVVAEALDVTRGGQERSIGEYCRALRAQDLEVAVVAGAGAGPPEGCAFVPIAAEGGTRSARLRALLAGAEREIARRRDRWVVQAMMPVRGADVYLPRSGLFPETFGRSRETRPTAAGRWLAGLGARFDARRRLLLEREAAILRDPQGPMLVALSDYVARSAFDHYRLGPPRVRVVRNGVDVAALDAATSVAGEVRAGLGIGPEAVVFLALAHNFRRKGIPELVEAARRLPAAPSWAVLVAGRGRPVRSAPPGVRFLGTTFDSGALFRAADVVVNPSFCDPCSRVVLEALALGRPVVTTRWDGASDFVGEAGCVLDDPRDHAALARALGGLLDPAARSRAASAAAGRRAAVSMDRHAAEMVRLLGEVRR